MHCVLFLCRMIFLGFVSALVENLTATIKHDKIQNLPKSDIVALEQFRGQRSEQKDYEVITPGMGEFGNYHGWAYCPPNSWAVGFAQRVEPHCGTRCDDTILNSLELICGAANGTRMHKIRSYDGIWGTWGDPVFCRGRGNFLRGAQFRVEPNKGKNDDDTSANDSRFLCTNGAVIQASNGGPFGHWYAAADCRPLTAICGFRLKFEGSQGSGDDTAMNGAQFVCCPT